jgi:glycerol-3-phosphate acyltransferase PlsY
LLSPVLAHFIYHDPDLAAVCSFIALLVWFRHRANIRRLLTGAEPKIGRKKTDGDQNGAAPVA